MSNLLDNIIFDETEITTVDELISLMEHVELPAIETVIPVDIHQPSKSKANSYSTTLVAGAFLLFLGVQDVKANPDKFEFEFASAQEPSIELLDNYEREVQGLFAQCEFDVTLINYLSDKSAFAIDDNLQVLEFATELFQGTKPLGGKEMEYLQECLAENSISKPTLPDRL